MNAMNWFESLLNVTVGTHTYWASILVGFALGLFVCNLVLVSGPATTLVPRAWLDAQALCVAELKRAKLSPDANPASWASARSFVESHADSIDASVRLIAEGRALVRAGQVGLKNALDELHEARLSALVGVDQYIETFVPDVATILKESPIAVPSVAAVVLTLVGMTWACGYYSMLGVSALPLLRSIAEISLVGIGAGIVPIGLFLFFAYRTINTALKAKHAARSELSGTQSIFAALDIGEKIQDASYWMPLAQCAFLLAFAVSVAYGTAVGLYPGTFFARATIVAEGMNGQPTLNIVGGLGRYVVGMSANKEAIAIPAEAIKCLAYASSLPGGASEPTCAPKPESKAVANVTVSVKPQELDQNWQAFVQRVARCNVDRSFARGVEELPFLFPRFEDDQTELVDSSYYETWPWKWPAEAGTWPQARAHPADTAAKKLAHIIAHSAIAKNDGSNRRSINVIGFASGTNTASHNDRVARARADFVARLLGSAIHGAGMSVCLIDTAVANPSCVEMRPLSGGEMPDFPWAGRQGEVSQRTVLIAACSSDVL
jgi:hypothetical protein